jgi:hypothetical protein
LFERHSTLDVRRDAISPRALSYCRSGHSSSALGARPQIPTAPANARGRTRTCWLSGQAFAEAIVHGQIALGPSLSVADESAV